MNKHQRNSNRRNAEHLRRISHVCENCGERGGHWVSTQGTSLASWLTGQDDQQGFWICPKMYGADGRRLPELVGSGT